jgi:predicted acyl esterase
MVHKYQALYLGSDGALSTRPRSVEGASQSLAWQQPSLPDGTLTYNSAPEPDGATLSGPIALTVYAKSSNTNLELIASLYDVAPDGTATLISNGALVGSQRALDQRKSWYDEHGLAVRPYQTAVADHYLRPNLPYRLDVSLRPRQWSIAPGHALRLVLTTQAPSAACATLIPLSTDPCFNTQPQSQSLPGGVYSILSDHRHPSTVDLPLLPHQYYATARSDVTATSNGFSVPLYWGPSS